MADQKWSAFSDFIPLLEKKICLIKYLDISKKEQKRFNIRF